MVCSSNLLHCNVSKFVRRYKYWNVNLLNTNGTRVKTQWLLLDISENIFHTLIGLILCLNIPNISLASDIPQCLLWNSHRIPSMNEEIETDPKLPCGNCGNPFTFSKARRIKSFIRSTPGNNNLDHRTPRGWNPVVLETCLRAWAP